MQVRVRAKPKPNPKTNPNPNPNPSPNPNPNPNPNPYPNPEQVGVFTVEQGRLQEEYNESLKYRPPEDAEYLSRQPAVEVEARLKDHQQQMLMRKVVLAMA